MHHRAPRSIAIRTSVDAFLVGFGVVLALGACHRDVAPCTPIGDTGRFRDAFEADTHVARAPDAARIEVSRDAAAVPIAMTAWTALGNGVAGRDVADATGSALFVGLAGWRITDASTRAWVDALTASRLHALGVGRVYAVRGPEDVSNRTHDLAVSALIDDLVAHASERTRTVLIAAHSSGQLVATELFHRLFVERADHGAALRDRILFVSLDGDADIAGEPTLQLSTETVRPLRHAWFVSARDSVRGTQALSNATMRLQQRRYADRSDYLEFDARDAGCTAVICVHLSLINPHPLARGNASYATFGTEGPNAFWLDAVVRAWR